MADAGETAETKPVKREGDGDQIQLVVKDASGDEMHFKVKSTTKFEKVIKAFCQRKSIEQDSIRFLFDGTRLNPNSTPGDLGMEDGDVIDAVIEQLGGGC